VRERMARILERLTTKSTLRFADFFQVEEGKLGVVVTFLALLELLRQEIINIIQHEPFGIVYLEKKIK
jgi:segregation and condensation protein A